MCCSAETAAAKSMQSSLTYVDSSPATIISKSTLHNVLMLEFEGEKSVSMTGRIFHNLFEVEKYLLPNVDPLIKFSSSKNIFALWSGKTVAVNYKIQIQSFVFYGRKHVLSPSLIIITRRCWKMKMLSFHTLIVKLKRSACLKMLWIRFW